MNTYSTSTAQDHSSVTPDDGDQIDPPFRALYVGTAGDVVITSLSGVDATYKNVAAGRILPVAGVKVKDTGTTATDIVAMY